MAAAAVPSRISRGVRVARADTQAAAGDAVGGAVSRPRGPDGSLRPCSALLGCARAGGCVESVLQACVAIARAPALDDTRRKYWRSTLALCSRGSGTLNYHDLIDLSPPEVF